jgi:hypothetical protein
VAGLIGDFLIFWEAAKALLGGASPYTVTGFYNPAWSLIPFIPLTLFSFDVARVLYALLAGACFVIALARFKIRPLYIVIIALCSSLLWLNILFLNLDCLVLLGMTLPPPIGIWLVMLKPQMAIGVVTFWFLRRETRRWYIFAPVGVMLVVNYAVFGLPKFSLGGAQANLFPLLIPVGLWLIVKAIQQSRINYAAPASAFLSAYYSLTSWIALAPLAMSRRWLLVVVIGSWLITILPLLH